MCVLLCRCVCGERELNSKSNIRSYGFVRRRLCYDITLNYCLSVCGYYRHGKWNFFPALTGSRQRTDKLTFHSINLLFTLLKFILRREISLSGASSARSTQQIRKKRISGHTDNYTFPLVDKSRLSALDSNRLQKRKQQTEFDAIIDWNSLNFTQFVCRVT